MVYRYETNKKIPKIFQSWFVLERKKIKCKIIRDWSENLKNFHKSSKNLPLFWVIISVLSLTQNPKNYFKIYVYSGFSVFIPLPSH